MSNAFVAATPISSSLVIEKNRLAFLPSKLGILAARFESIAFSFMDDFWSEYNGGYWEFFNLDNGGFYLQLQTDLPLLKMGFPNLYENALSPEVAGIVITLYALSHLSFEAQAACVSEQYHLLRDYALDHPHAGQIFQAID